MTPVPDERYDALERRLVAGQHRRRYSERTILSQPAFKDTPEIEALVSLAQQLQAASPLQVDPAFAHRLEKRVLARHVALRRSQATHKGWHWSLFGFSPARSAVILALCLLIVVTVTSTGVLLVAAQVDDPTNPLYAVKHWEQQVQVSFASSSTDQAELHLHYARDQLATLGDFTDAPKAASYQQALTDFEQQITMATQQITALPAGPDQERLTRELAALQTDARQTLRQLLRQLAIPERVLTTDELGHLGDTVPVLTQVQVTLPAQPNGQALVSISGSNLQPGAQLLINGQPVAASGTMQNGSYLFTVNWQGNEHLHTIGILNPDGTAAQTTQVSIQTSTTGGGNGNGNGSGNGSGGNGGNGGGNGNGSGGNGNGSGKPEGTPTPHA
jgi:hypothetical protein